MKIRPWNFYAVRERFDEGDERRMALILRPHVSGQGWVGHLLYEEYHHLPATSRWGMFGGRLPSGSPCVDDLTEHLISCRDLLFRKLNPPMELILAGYQRRLLEDFAA